jgi:uncharacterized protein YdhG (YjbR/CyaY superfamily)
MVGAAQRNMIVGAHRMPTPASRATLPGSTDDYFRALAPDVRVILEKIRATVRAAAPDATERMSYRMPAFFENGPLIYFAAFKNHVGVFPPVTSTGLRRQLARYAGPKGNLRFPLDEPIPYALIARIVKARLRENRRRAALKKTTKTRTIRGIRR